MDQQLQPALKYFPHPLTTMGQEARVAAFLPNETLEKYCERVNLDIRPQYEVVVWHNGHRVPSALWTRLIPKTGDQIIIRTTGLHGGGGDSNKVFRTVALLALALTAPYLAGAAMGLGWTAATGFTGGLISAGIMIGGSLLINALLPPPKPSFDIQVQQKYESSPTYSISGGRNRARQWDVMPIVFGRHKLVPDYGSNYFTEFVGDDQYLNQVFNLGLQGTDLQIDEIRIGETPINNYQGVQVEVSGADGRLTMFPGNVDTIQGFALPSGEVIARTTALDVVHIRVDLAAQLYRVRDDGGIDARTVELRVQWRQVGGEWREIGLIENPVYATHYWAFEVDYSYEINDESSSGLFNTGTYQVSFGSTNFGDYTDGQADTVNGQEGFWRWKPHPFRLGQPWYGIAPDPIIGYSSRPGVQITGARQEPSRITLAWNVPSGQYEIRAWKISPDISDARESNQTAVSQILTYQVDNADYTGQRRMAVRIKATGQLNGAVDELNVVAAVQIPIFDGVDWLIRRTSNPAWWFLWFARGKVAGGERIYGAGLLDSQIDFDAIKAWAVWCDENRLTFNWVLDRKMSCADVLQTIARAGRASPTWQTGKLGIVWDAANLPVVAMFGPFNITSGSFNVAYLNEGSVDEVLINFINPARNWEVDVVRVSIPEAIGTNNPLTLDLEGCTSADQAGREANLIAASQVWHRRRVSWETDIEGWVCTRGDVVQLSHDLTVWGYSGRLFGRSGQNLVLDKFVPSAGSGVMMLRDPEGNMKTVNVTGSIGEVDSLTVTSDLTGFPMPGDAGYEESSTVDWAWFFDPLETPGRRFKITSVEPSVNGVKFEAIDDDPRYYASEFNPFAYTPPRDGTLLAGILLSLNSTEKIISVVDDIIEVTISWVSTTRSDYNVALTVNGIARQPVRTENRSIAVEVQTGSVISAVVTPIRQAGQTGRPGIINVRVTGLRSPLPAVAGLTNLFRDGLTVLRWVPVSDPRNPDYEVRIGPDWDNARTVAISSDRESLTFGNGLYWVAARFVGRGYTVYGPADSLLISGSVLTRNVLVTVDEHPSWDGTVSDGAVIDVGELTLAGSSDLLAETDILAITDLFSFGGQQTYGVYQTNSGNVVDIGYVAPVRISFDLSEFSIDILDDFLAYENVLSEPDILVASNRQFYSVTPQIRFAGDDMVFGAWVDYLPGLINARYFDVRLVLETQLTNIIPYVDQFSWTIDVPDLVQKAEKVVVPDTGLTITYATSYNVEPNVQIAVFDAIDGDRYVLNNSDENGFDIQIFNGSTPVERTINWISQGY